MRQSMTGFAAKSGALDDAHWHWDLRSVNHRGLDLRLRLPDTIEGLEPSVRKAASDRLARGAVQITLRLTREEAQAQPRIDPQAMAAALDALAQVEAAAQRAGVTLAPSTGADILGLRGVLTVAAPAGDAKGLRDRVVADFHDALAQLIEARRAEGARLAEVIDGHLTQIEALVTQAAEAAAARAPARAERLRAQLARVQENAEEIDADRVAQELALLAVRADVTEEIDRLALHVAAARDLLAQTGAVGRKLDFLCQEFMREANTLCSKSGDAALTNAGLALKTVIEQMREQIQNLE